MTFPGRTIREWVRIALSGGILACCLPVHAHSVVVWAESIGEEIQVETFLSGGQRPRQGTIEVRDDNGALILEGQLDDRGRFRFAVPDASALKIRVKLSPEHQNEFELPLDSADSP